MLCHLAKSSVLRVALGASLLVGAIACGDGGTLDTANGQSEQSLVFPKYFDAVKRGPGGPGWEWEDLVEADCLSQVYVRFALDIGAFDAAAGDPRNNLGAFTYKLYQISDAQGGLGLISKAEAEAAYALVNPNADPASWQTHWSSFVPGSTTTTYRDLVASRIQSAVATLNAKSSRGIAFKDNGEVSTYVNHFATAAEGEFSGPPFFNPAGSTPIIDVTATSTGASGNDITIDIMPATDQDAGHFDLTVHFHGTLTTYHNLDTTLLKDNLDATIAPTGSTPLIKVTKLIGGRPNNVVGASLTKVSGFDSSCASGWYVVERDNQSHRPAAMCGDLLAEATSGDDQTQIATCRATMRSNWKFPGFTWTASAAKWALDGSFQYTDFCTGGTSTGSVSFQNTSTEQIIIDSTPPGASCDKNALNPTGESGSAMTCAFANAGNLTPYYFTGHLASDPSVRVSTYFRTDCSP